MGGTPRQRRHQGGSDIVPAVRRASCWCFEIPADTLNRLCWFGALDGSAAAVESACERAVTLNAANVAYHDSRALTRALLGKRDGAILDWQYLVNNARGSKIEPQEKQRRAWLSRLQAGGRFVLTPEERQLLLTQ